MYSFTDASMAVFTWDAMDYFGGVGGWGVQIVLLPSGDFQMRQVQGTSDMSRNIAIGISDGSTTDNSSPGSTGIDWDAILTGAPTPMGFTDIGSRDVGGNGTGVVVYFAYDAVNGYIVTRLQ